MSMIIKKNQIVSAVVLVALCSAVFINWYYSKPASTDDTSNLGEAAYVNATAKSASKSTTKSPEKNTMSEYFANCELRRKNAHDKALETIKSVISNKDSSKEAVENATKELDELSATIKKEADLENILKAKINSQCIVILNDGKAEIIVENSKLNDDNLSVIKTTILEQTDTVSENISIIGAK